MMDNELSSSVRAKTLLGKMSLVEKITQMNCSGCLYDLDSVLSNLNKGIDLVHGEYYWFKSFSLEKLKEMEERLVEVNPHGIPAFVACENVHGAALPYTTIFPTPGCLGASFDVDLAYRVSRMQAKEIRALGFNKVYAPNLDLFRDPRWGRCEEDISEDPYLLSKMASSIVKGIQEGGVMACVKHYLGYSSPESGLNLAPMHMGEREIREYFLPPFKSAIDAGAKGVMTSYNVIDGVPVTISPLWMNKVLREELKFDGVTILDYGMSGIMKNVMGISSSCVEEGKRLLEASIDLEACEPLCYNFDFIESIKDNEKYLSLIDKSVYRILKAKFDLGLFDNPSFDVSKIKEKVGTKEAFDLTYEEEAKGAVLLKNNGTLPLKENTKILLVGPNADIAQLGGITYYACLENYIANDAMSEKATNPLDALISRFGKENIRFHKGCNFLNYDKSQEESIKEDIDWCDVIVFAGGNNSIGYSLGDNGGKDHPLMKEDAVTSSEGYDTSDIGLGYSQKELLHFVASFSKKVVFLIYGGKPISFSEEELDKIDGLLYCFGTGMNGNLAIADILKGNISPSGKLPFSIARSSGHLPCFYNHYLPKGNYSRPGSKTKPGQDYVFSANTSLFPFGFGLSYSSFEYSCFTLKITNGVAKLSFKIKNTGNYDADEIVLVYGRSLENEYVSIMAKRLAGFTRISLPKGETKNLEFSFTKRDFAYIGIDNKETLPNGKIELEVANFKKEFTYE